MSNFLKFAFTPAGLGNPALAISACRAGGIGVLNGELETNSKRILRALDLIARKGCDGYGLKLDALHDGLLEAVSDYASNGLRWLILDAEVLASCEDFISEMRSAGVNVLVEVKTSGWPDQQFDSVIDGLVLKGNEAGGFVGDDGSFILLQKWLNKTKLPLYVRGGLTPQVAAACAAVGAAGGVLDSQVLLLKESGISEALRSLLGNLAGNETVAVGDSERGEYFRLLVRPGFGTAQTFISGGEGLGFDALNTRVSGKVDWAAHRDAILPIGQDVCFASNWRTEYPRLIDIFNAIDAAVDTSLRQAVASKSVFESAPLAEALGLRLPIVQGPMTRVSDSAEFAFAVAEGGALPMVAFALLKGPAVKKLLTDTTRLLGDRPWGIGLLGFAPQSLLDEQLAIATEFHPKYAIIAGGRPDQAVHLESAGIPSFLHVPSANLISLFLEEGARRFIFEGRECGGHVGPLSSFVLWSSMVDRLRQELMEGKVPAEEIQLLFAGGIHDAVSSAMLQVLVAPLVAEGVKVGILMGSAYLFTNEIVSTGAIVPTFQEQVIDCIRTVNLESGPGHASRCAYTPFAKEFFDKQAQLRADNVPADEARKALDDLILGRLRIASKGRARTGPKNELQSIDEDHQRVEGMYMLGQVATLRSRATDIATLHREVSEDAVALLAETLNKRAQPKAIAKRPADIAIVGTASLLPKANSSQEFWENILNKVDAITEIPSHRWDWRLYYSEDRKEKDKIYSKWGGFLDDLAFDPTCYGMPPKSLASVDPMQLMALEVAQRTLADAGYDQTPFDRERASVIIGASGGVGDVGTQYGLRAELPRFHGSLPQEVADRLPEWTEDSFAGILVNVIAGRIANRLNLGGVNFTTDAACASSLAAIYQGVSELSAGRSDLVIAGGVDTVQGPFGYLCFSKTQALSPRGRCSTFDVSGDGIVISEGIAMVALKRLEDAERDGDRVYAVIKGVGGSSDGNAKGLTAPLPAGQLRAMRRAYEQAGFGPDTVTLFEAHGTGTVAGDTAELESTTNLIKEAAGGPRQAAVGSVKTMIGHTKATAGVAGLIKTVLALHHRVLPPHRGVSQPNLVLQDAESPLYLVDQALPWVTPSTKPRRAAVSAFGFGGTNFHVVLEEYKGEYRNWLQPAPAQRWPAELLLWSEVNRDGLIERLLELQKAMTNADDFELRDLAASLAANRVARGETLAIVAKDAGDLGMKISAALSWLRGDASGLPYGVNHGVDAPKGKLAVLFPGQGSQYAGMMRESALYFPELAAALSDADEILDGAFEPRCDQGSLLSHFIFPRGCYSDEAKKNANLALMATDIAQPALGAVEAGLLQVMSGLALEPDMFAGHSFGEFVALHAGGAIDFGALMSLSAGRGRCIVEAVKVAGAELGTMAAVPAIRQDVELAIADIADVSIANHNAPMQSIISGSEPAVQAAIAKLATKGIEATAIPVAAAFHSRFVKPAQRALSDLIGGTEWRAATLPVYSNTTGKKHAADVAQTKKLMADHLVSTVEFTAEIETMYRDGARIFFELGPKSVLTGLTQQILEDRPHVAIAIDDGTGLIGTLNAFGKLMCAGVELNIAKLFDGRDCIIADPANLETLDRKIPVSKFAWMINGSGVRKAADPVRQIGVTADKSSERPLPTGVARSLPPVQSTTEPATVTRPSRPISQGSIENKERYMEEKNLPVAGDSAIMADYFDTMRQFLATQERVMGMLLGEQPLSGRLQSRQPRRTSPTRASTNILPAVAAPSPQPTLIEVPTKSVAAPAESPIKRMGSNGGTPEANGANGANGAHALVDAATEPPPSSTKEEPGAVGHVDRARMEELLLSVVEDTTGYPRDMVGLDQNLESDLGIDSIKRIELVGTMLQALPEHYRNALGESRSELNTQATLNGILSMLSELSVEGAATSPFDHAGTGEEVGIASHPSRQVSRYSVIAKQEVIDTSVLRQLNTGHFLITEDSVGVAAALAQSLTEQGCQITLVSADVISDIDRLQQWVANWMDDNESVAGLVHLAQLDASWLDTETPLDDWREQLQRNEMSLFVLLRELSEVLGNGAHVLSASALGGLFGRQAGAARGLSLQGGSVGMLKSLFEERPTLRIKAVDVDPSLPSASIASILLAEMELAGGRQEVGYPKGIRTVFHTVEAAVEHDQTRTDELQNAVILATGGARGVTAEVLRELAVPGNTLVLTGRQPLPGSEPQALNVLMTAAALREHYIAQVRSGESTLNPAEIGRKVQAILAARELRANIEDFRRAGATVEYHSVDVTNEDAMRELLESIYTRFGKITGVVHGAGVIEDKLLADKTTDSWSRVIETKVFGLLLLQRYLQPESLQFFSVFSSVAGRYGNSGQSDYATANELMNRLCCQLRDHWRGRVNVKAFCWGPWGPTKFGVGMVTAETEAKFAEKGVALVTAEGGRQMFADEMTYGNHEEIEIVCGEGPWEQREAANGKLNKLIVVAPQQVVGPLLGGGTPTSLPQGEHVFSFPLDSTHAYLAQHCIDGVPILPAAAALEVLAEAVGACWPGWQVIEVRDVRLLKGVEVRTDQELAVVISPPTYGSSDGFDVSAVLQSKLDDGKVLIHYRAVMRLGQQLPCGFEQALQSHTEKELTVAQAYDEWLFHGPCFQVLERIDGLSEAGARAVVGTTHPNQWIINGSSELSPWLFDPAVVDAAPQMAILWARAFRGATALPTRFGRVIRYRETLPQQMLMEFECLESPDPGIVRANVYYTDTKGQIVLLIEEMECVASAALNRLGGTTSVSAVVNA